jgi:nucleotide-binding universal stress UspA family protein
MHVVLRRILVPIDFSDRSHAALTYAVSLVEQFDAALHLLHIVEALVAAETLPTPPDPCEDVERAIEARAWDDSRRVRATADLERLHAKLTLEWGTPFVEIVRYARAHDIDLIAMGTHERGGVRHLLMGSVAENVVRSSPCLVLTVRHPEHELALP